MVQVVYITRGTHCSAKRRNRLQPYSLGILRRTMRILLLVQNKCLYLTDVYLILTCYIFLTPSGISLAYYN